jgi:hypothetical protein
MKHYLVNKLPEIKYIKKSLTIIGFNSIDEYFFEIIENAAIKGINIEIFLLSPTSPVIDFMRKTNSEGRAYFSEISYQYTLDRLHSISNNTPVKISSVINNDLFVKTSMMG